MSAPIDPALIPADVLALCRRLRDAGHQAHLVGGGVRDMLLGRTPSDFDVATDALPNRLLSLFGARYAIPTGLQHGTVTVLCGDPPHQRPVEVTTFRGEGEYLDGRRPSTVTFSATLDEDLSRRDFTMNAIAWDPIDHVLADPFAGQTDLAARLVRAVRDPRERFREDGLRPMRAVRQATQLEFEIEPATFAAIPQTLDSFRKVSSERIRDELGKLLLSRRPSRGMDLLRTSGLLAEIIPELLESVGCPQNRYHKHDVWNHTLHVLDEARPDLVVRWAALLHDVGKPRARTPKDDAPGEFGFFKHEFISGDLSDAILRRLKLPNAQRDAILALVTQHMFFYTPDWTDGTVRRFVKRVGTDNLDPLFALREADIAGRGFEEDREKETRELRLRIAALMAEDTALGIKDLAIDGRDVMRILAGPPGRHIGLVLEALLEKVIDDPALNTRETLEALVPAVAAALPAPGPPR